MKKRILLLTVVLLMMFSLSMTVYASHPVPDLSRNGSITLRMAPGDVPLNDGFLNIYKVGELSEDDGNYFFTLMDGRVVTHSEEISLILAEELLTLAKEEKLVARVARIEEGQAVFHDLQHGLYVVWQAKADASKGYMPINPFLLSVPRFVEGAYELDVVADPKVALETVPPTTAPPPPRPPELPQSGQLNWPVPVLAVSGAVLMILGFLLISRKRAGNA
jgi:hypothetical protein